MSDLYGKFVLSIIAVSLVILCIQNALSGANAASRLSCGEARNPCYVTAAPGSPVYVATPRKAPLVVLVGP
jgi:hypothetical protein